MRQLHTAMFFEASDDPVLMAVEDSRRSRLVGIRENPNTFRFDIRLRGEGETPFFDD